MLFLADENTHGGVVRRLRDAKLDVEWIKQSTPGASDADILHRADIATLTMITNDRDFGDLIFNRGFPTPSAILYIRLPHRLAALTAERILALIEGGDLKGHMITITKDGERRKPFPVGAPHA